LRAQTAGDSLCSGGNVETHGKKGLALQAGSFGRGRSEKYVGPEGLELSASLFDGDSVLQAANGMEPEDRAAFQIEAARRNERYGWEGNGNFGRLAGHEAAEPLAGDANDCERMAFDADLFTHDIGSGAELALPKLIADDSDLGICSGAEIRIVRRKQAAKKRSCAKYGVGVAGNGEDAVLGKYAVDFNIAEGVRAPGHKRGEDPLAAFDFAEH